MNIVAIVPARMGSSRFPGKPLAPICGIPMIGHIHYRAQLAKELNDCWIATCDQEIMDYVHSIGGKAVMTSDKHERASDRCAEAMLKIEEKTGKKIDMVVMIQGDEPMVTPHMIDSAASAMKDAAKSGVGIACLMGPIETTEEFNDPNCIKVVVGHGNRAIYMSREPIPTVKRGATQGPWLKQVCIIPFTRDYLLQFNDTPPSKLEIAESIDLNRCLENGHPVQMAFSPDKAISVDTPSDLKKADAAMQKDPLFAQYRDKVPAETLRTGT